MNYKQVLRYQPWLRLVNRHNISDRLLELTDGDMFMVYNTMRETHELHSVRSFRMSASSHNVALDEEFVNGFIISDFKAHNHRKFGLELESQRQHSNYLHERHERERSKLDEMLKTVERTIGTKL